MQIYTIWNTISTVSLPWTVYEFGPLIDTDRNSIGSDYDTDQGMKDRYFYDHQISIKFSLVIPGLSEPKK